MVSDVLTLIVVDTVDKEKSLRIESFAAAEQRNAESTKAARKQRTENTNVRQEMIRTIAEPFRRKDFASAESFALKVREAFDEKLATDERFKEKWKLLNNGRGSRPRSTRSSEQSAAHADQSAPQTDHLLRKLISVLLTPAYSAP